MIVCKFLINICYKAKLKMKSKILKKFISISCAATTSISVASSVEAINTKNEKQF